MRKKNFLMLLGLAGLGLTAQAQVIATLGFEDGDQFYHHKDSAQFADFYGDHINLQPGDVWNEKKRRGLFWYVCLGGEQFQYGTGVAMVPWFEVALFAH